MKLFAAISTTISALFWGGLALADDAPCRSVIFEDVSFTLCEADPRVDDIRLFLSDTGGTFTGVEASLGEGETLVFAMNGGMYHADRQPVGLYIEDGTERQAIVTREGPGNFGLLPNGVLCLGDGRAAVIESRAFAADPPACRFATQSGPMLVIDGALHPRFLVNSDSRFIRNGVGVRKDGTLVAAISDSPVTFHRFGRFFRDVVRTPNALFLDGKVSRLHAPAIGRSDFGFPVGPILGVVGRER